MFSSGSLDAYGIPSDCYVLEDGRRVLSQRGVVRALTAGGESGVPRVGSVERYLARLPNKYAHLATCPTVEFTLSTGGVALGIEADKFVEIVSAYAELYSEGQLKTSQLHIGRQCLKYVVALAKVGLDALVDEATGYQHVRAHDALSQRMAQYLRDVPSPYKVFWGERLRLSLKRVFRCSDAPLAGGVIPKIYDIILGADIRKEAGRRRDAFKNTKSHQMFAEMVAECFRTVDMQIVELIANQSSGKREFWNKLSAHYRNTPLQLGFYGERQEVGA
jgi:hypothetical protein